MKAEWRWMLWAVAGLFGSREVAMRRRARREAAVWAGVFTPECAAAGCAVFFLGGVVWAGRASAQARGRSAKARQRLWRDDRFDGITMLTLSL